MKRFLTHILSATLVAVAALTAAGCSEKKPPVPDFYEEIRSADKMVLATMAVTKTAKTERTDWYKVGKRIAVYSYDSYLQAYVDLSQLQPDDVVVDEEKRAVTITLPAVVTEPAGRELQMHRVYENVGLLRTDIDAKERAEIKEKANASFLREVAQNPEFQRRLTEAAQRKARAYFESLFAMQGYTAYVNFKPSN